MKKYLNIILSSLIICIMILLVGCNDNVESSKIDTTTTTNTTENQSNNDDVTVTYPVTITDQAEREVVIEKEPTKIVSGYYISSSILIALGEKDNLVGLENLPKGSMGRPIYDLTGLAEKNIIGYGTKKAFETEKAALLEPNLIVIPYSLKDQANTISEACAAPVIVVNPESDVLMNETLDILSTATNSKAKANELNNYVSNKLASIKNNTIENNKAYFVSASSSVLETLTGSAYQTTMLKNAGLVNVCESLEGMSATVSYEDILLYNPDYIIIAADSKISVDDVLSDNELKEVSAVVNQKVYKIPGNIEAWDTPIPAVFLASLYISCQTSNYTIEEFNTVAKEFYQTFYGATIEL